jgi:hypothetical protein
MKTLTTISALSAAVLACIAPPAAAAEGEWQHTVILYGMGAAIEGDAQIGDLAVPVDLNASDVLDALEMGAMGAYRADNGTWSITADATFMGLGGTGEGDRGLLKGDVDVDQITLMATLGRHVQENFELLFSLAYMDLSADLTARIRNPVTGVETRRSASKDASWIDPLIGSQYSVPFANGWRFNLRGDIGGFGIGSELTYQVLTGFRWQSSGNLGAALGYRLIAFDYEDGKGSNYQNYDLTEQGPLIGVTYSF